jgi:hypothetical protein
MISEQEIMRLALLLAALALALAASAALLLGWWPFVRPPGPAPPPPGPGPPDPGPPPPKGGVGWRLTADLLPERPDASCVAELFALEAGAPGVDMRGDLRDAAGKLLSGGLGRSADELARHPLTFPAGHSYYDASAAAWGHLGAAASWGEFARRFGDTVGGPDGAGLADPAAVLFVEGGAAPCVLRHDADLLAVVVRRGGVLLIDESVALLRAGFVLVEAGGLLQAGSRYGDGRCRFRGALVLELTHREDDARRLASRYSAEVYNPGHYLDGFPKTGLPSCGYMGPAMKQGCSLSNVFGRKVIGVGFNGAYELCGEVPAEVPYAGTWSTSRPGAALPTRGWLPDAYPLCWARLLAVTADRQGLVLDPEDSPAAAQAWRPGDRLVVTDAAEHFVAAGRPSGALRWWADADDAASRAANEAANAKYDALLPPEGVELARVASVEVSSGAVTVRLREALRFPHGLGPAALRSEAGEALTVNTRLHVGWLSRRIVVTADRRPAKTSPECNNGLAPNYAGGGAGGGIASCFDPAARSGDWQAAFGGGAGSPLPRPDDVRGHWLFHNEGAAGCGAVYGGQQLFRYGSSVCLDGVEVRYMGVPANFGAIGTYPVHFHLAGYASSFAEYLPAGAGPGHRRDLRVANCAVWASYARFVNVHGTCEATVQNNVGCLTYGNGFFTEDGTELRNLFDHNLAVGCLPAVFNPYHNPTPVAPLSSSDACVASAFWFKNNQNAMTRNVCCCSPAPVVAVWYVPQKTSVLRGISAVCLGREDLRLPGFASRGNAAGPEGLCEATPSNAGGAQVAISGGRACWVPDDWPFALTDPATGCNALTTDNSLAPVFANAENVVYAMAGYQSEFNEALELCPAPQQRGGCIGCGAATSFGEGVPAVYLPGDALNGCSDARAAAVYPMSRWTGDLPRQPLEGDELARVDALCATQPNWEPAPVASDRAWVRAVPKLFSGLLLFRTGPSANGLWWGAGWTKSSPAWLLGCCLLGDPSPSAVPLPAGAFAAQAPLYSSTNFISGYNHPLGGGRSATMAGLHPVYHNLILRGGLATLPYPCVFSGEGTFVDAASVFADNGIEGASDQGQAFNYFFAGLGAPVDRVFGGLWLRGGGGGGGAMQSDLRLVDLDAARVKTVGLAAPRVVKADWKAVALPPPTRKYPFVCGDDGRALAGRDGAAAVGFVVGPLFDAGAGRAVLDGLCALLAKIPPRMPSSPPQDLGAAPGSPPACFVATDLAA